jgi:hypothetical protein
MNHRRLRRTATLVLMALGAPVLAAEPTTSDRGDTAVANLQRDARDLRDNVRQNSVQFGHQVAHGAHQARHQFTVEWYRAGASIHHWWDHTRETVARI